MDGCLTATLALVMHWDAKLRCSREADDSVVGVALIQDSVDHRRYVTGVVADTIASPHNRLAVHSAAHRPHFTI
ncbi:protein of unknown function (plasmid) [Cupriavidus taiwanensis]|uniref:Uncharacterized protein n=1 Tax=Cupriavidus taiwanensis TaxID=164546 RepID=A0A375IJX6_9BURK|nr:protein of unknown function [Cupriavidus taiwanensis]